MGLDLKRLGLNVRFLRESKGWSLQDLAEQARLSKPYLSGLENGEGGRPNIEYLYQIATALGTTIDGLLSGTAGSQRKTTAARLKREDLPESLRLFIEQANVSEEEAEMLAKVHYRGHRPQEVEGWRLIYEAIRFGTRRGKE